ncbi:MAG: hypothetical protein WCK83_14695 [Burkholderiales bacterium]|jgi:hypothetical protein
MAIHTSFLGATTISGNEAKAFTRRVLHARGTKAASEAVQNGRKMMTAFNKKRIVTIKLDVKNRSAVQAG